MDTFSASVRRQTASMASHSRGVVLARLFALLLVATDSLPLAQAALTRELVGPTGANHLHIISPAGGRVATIGNIGSREVVYIDGVPGPQFDQIFRPTAYPAWRGLSSNSTLIFSPDGERYAYAARSGQDLVIILDGEEVYRGPVQARSGQPALAQSIGLCFSPKGKHFYFVIHQEDGAQLFLNGKLVGNAAEIVFCGEDRRYVCRGLLPGKRDKPLIVIDGRQAEAGYLSADKGRLDELVSFMPHTSALLVLVHVTPEGGERATVVLNNGRPILESLYGVRLFPAPTGKRLAAIIRTKENRRFHLWLDGKIVPGSDDVTHVLFSPDGSRYAALVESQGGRSSIILDGKKGPEYQHIGWNRIEDSGEFTPLFTADSSKFLYVAHNGGLAYIVVNDEESEGYEDIRPVLSPDRNTWGAVLKSGGQYHIMVNKAVRATGIGISSSQGFPVLSFSPDGSRFAYLLKGGYGKPSMLGVDGRSQVEVGDALFAYNMSYQRQHGASRFDGAARWTGVEAVLFTPESKEFVYKTYPEKGRASSAAIGGKRVPNTETGFDFPTFTPDGAHLFWTTRPRGKDDVRTLIVNGQELGVVDISSPRLKSGEIATQLHSIPGTWEMGADSVLTLLGVTEEGIYRYRAVPPTDHDFSAMLRSLGGAGSASASVNSAPVSDHGRSTAQTEKPAVPAPRTGPVQEHLEQVQQAKETGTKAVDAVRGLFRKSEKKP